MILDLHTRESFKETVKIECTNIRRLCAQLCLALNDIPKSHITSLFIELNENSKDYSVKEFLSDSQFSIFKTFEMHADQNAKNPVRLPGVIQLPLNYQDQLTPLIDEINFVKGKLEKLKTDLKVANPNVTNKVIRHLLHQALPSIQLLQLTRKINWICEPVYLGVSLHKKPTNTKISKLEALTLLTKLHSKVPEGFSSESWTQELHIAREDIELTDENSYKFVLLREGAYRPMLNYKDKDGSPFQITNSMPVICFTDAPLSVSLPRYSDNEKTRNDKLYFDHNALLKPVKLYKRKILNEESPQA